MPVDLAPLCDPDTAVLTVAEFPAIVVTCPRCGQRVAVDEHLRERACGHGLMVSTSGCLIDTENAAAALGNLARIADGYIWSH